MAHEVGWNLQVDGLEVRSLDPWLAHVCAVHERDELVRPDATKVDPDRQRAGLPGGEIHAPLVAETADCLSVYDAVCAPAAVPRATRVLHPRRGAEVDVEPAVVDICEMRQLDQVEVCLHAFNGRFDAGSGACSLTAFTALSRFGALLTALLVVVTARDTKGQS